MYEDDEFEEEELDIEEYPTLRSVARFTKLLGSVNWFRSVGLELGANTRKVAEDYTQNLGFPDAYVAPVENWEEAAYAAANPDWNTEWWEAEEQLMASLTAQALELMTEEDLGMALSHIAATASPVVQHAVENLAEEAGIEDEELIRAAIGAALQACHQSALVLAAGEEDTHPFALKYQLFELGRWPIGITGGSFNLF
ncbi:hypothetical protein [Sneathiella sp.]|jgi:hypothetical protein|uniref:hypothetical protein n=1 Tax=Sneathiella sp. TaxID=1964365 RepID=UPI0039E4A716